MRRALLTAAALLLLAGTATGPAAGPAPSGGGPGSSDSQAKTYNGTFRHAVAVWGLDRWERTGDEAVVVPNRSVQRVDVRFSWDDPTGVREWKVGLRPPCKSDPAGRCVATWPDWFEGTTPVTFTVNHSQLFDVGHPGPGPGNYTPMIRSPDDDPFDLGIGANANREVRWQATVHFD